MGRATSDAEQSPRAGDWVGRYLVLGQLGTGGMGIVYSAYDPKVDRRVALKLLRPAQDLHQARDSVVLDQAATRLLREAKALARLADPNVLTLYDVTKVDGRLVLAMELVQGRSLDRWLATRTRSMSAILDVLHQAGLGLWAVHRAGLIHRDFKPQNVLVADDGRVLVADFGLARDADSDSTPDERAETLKSRTRNDEGDRWDGELTQAGDILGTPSYMSPEQHQGRAASTSSDQFSFCVTAFEALTGQRPFRGHSRADTLARIRRGPRLETTSRHGRRLPRTIRNALRRGLAPHERDRFADMQHLLEALFERPRRRSKSLALAIAMAGATSLATAHAHHERPADVRCARGPAAAKQLWSHTVTRDVRAAFESAIADYGAESFARVDLQLRSFGDRWAQQYRETCTDTDNFAGSGERTFDARMACLGRGMDHARQLVDQYRDADASTVRQAVSAALALPDPSLCDKTALEPDERPWPDRPQLRHAVAELRDQLAHIRVLASAGRHEAAHTRLEALVISPPDGSNFSPVRAELHLLMGRTLITLHDTTTAIEHLERARVLARASGHREVAFAALTELIIQRAYYQRDIEEGTSLYRAAEALSVALDRPVQGRIDLWTRSGLLAALTGRHADSVDAHRRALELARDHYGELHLEVGTAYQRLGSSLWWRSDHAQAAEAFKRSLDIESYILGASHPGLARPHANLAYLQAVTGNYEDAARQGLRAIDLCASELGSDHRSCSSYHDNVASYLVRLGRFSDAGRLLEQLERVQTREGRRAHPEDPWARVPLAELALRRGQLAAASRLAELGLEQTVAEADAPADNRVTAYRVLAEVQLARGDVDAARTTLERAMAIDIRADGERSESAELLRVRGVFERARGRPKRAHQLHERALAQFAIELCDDCPDAAPHLLASSRSARMAGHIELAQRRIDLAIQRLERALGPGHPRLGEYRYEQGLVRLAHGDRNAARRSLQQARELVDSSPNAAIRGEIEAAIERAHE